MEHLCGDERLTVAGMKYGNRKEFQAKLPPLSSLSLALGQRLGDNGTARLYRGSHSGSPRPPSSQAAPTVRVVPLALIPSLPHQLLPISFGEFSPLHDPFKKKREKIGNFRVFFS